MLFKAFDNIAFRFSGKSKRYVNMQKEEQIPARGRMASLFPLNPVYGARVAPQRCTILRHG